MALQAVVFIHTMVIEGFFGEFYFMPYDFSRVTVLVIDTQPLMLDLIQGVLNLLGIKRVVTRSDGASGLRAFDEFDPDLLIIDWDLKNLDGMEFTRKIRASKKNPFVPVIFMTAFSSRNRVLQARDSGITEFMAKPFTARALCSRIETIIERPRQFVKTESFFGPDRRRKKGTKFQGKNSRGSDTIEADTPPSADDNLIEIDFIDKPEQDKK